MQHLNGGRARVQAVSKARSRVIALVVVTLLLVAGLSRMTVAQPADCANLVQDSGLENGSGWSTHSSGNYALLSNYLVHSGAQAAHLAGVDNAADQLSTTLALPADKKTVTLSFWWQIHSEEVSAEFDGLTVLVADAA